MFDFEDHYCDDDDEDQEVDRISEGIGNVTRTVDTFDTLESTFIAVAQSLNRQLRCISQLGEPVPLDIIADLAVLLDVHERLEVLEESFYHENASQSGSQSAALEILRAEIGGQLDRLRAAIVAGTVSEISDAPAT